MQTIRRISASPVGPSRLALAASLIWISLTMGMSAYAQTSEQTPAQGTSVLAPVIPQQVRYAGNLAARSGDTVEAVFSIYAAREGGEPLWTETQKVTVGADGSYSALLGSANPSGLPQTLFAAGAARWLGVSVERAPEQARVLLSSVPYAMKSADTQALAGHPAGDFVTQEQLSEFAQSEAQRVASAAFNPLLSGTITGSGTAGSIAQFTGTNTIGNSELTQSGMNIGVNEPSPAAMLDVGGTGQFRGTLTLPALSAATTAVGERSQELQWSSSAWSTIAAAAVSPTYKMYVGPVSNNTSAPAGTLLFTYQLGTGAASTILSLNSNGSFVTYGGVTAKTPTLATSSAASSSPFLGLGASVYQSSTSSAVAQNFDWQAIPTGNNTTTPSSNIALLYGSGPATPTPTGFSISSTGLINWASGQTFPGTGAITGVTAGTGLTGGGTVGNVTLNVDTTQVPLLAANDNFTGALTASSLSTTGTVNAASYDLGGALFDSGLLVHDDAFLGFAGNGNAVEGFYNTAAGSYSLYSDTGSYNSALGAASLYNNTSGGENTAMGEQAMYGNQTGGSNTAIGFAALSQNTTGGNNTGVGESAGPDYASQNLQDSTAIGAEATVSQSNSLVLGQTIAGSPGASYVNVGIGTPTPESAIDIAVTAAGALGPTLTLTNPGGDGASASIDFKTYLHPSTLHSPTGRILATDDNDYGTNLSFMSKTPGSDSNGLQTNMAIYSDGQVAIPSAASGDNSQLEVSSALGMPQGISVYGSNASGSTNGGDGGVFVGGTTFSGQGGGGVWGYGGNSVSGQDGDAGYFSGDVQVEGTLSASTKDFKIDDPADPANKYLYHSSVESSEMMNIYTGNIVTDKLGLASVKLPDWFQAENTDFRYQLTVIGRFAQAIVSKEVENNQFQIATNASFVKVSWQITAVRQDAYAKAHPLVPEKEKPAAERGYYIHPELFGQPEEKQIEWARRPDLMRHIKAHREAARVLPASPALSSELPASERPPVPVFHPRAAQNNTIPAHNSTPAKSSKVTAPSQSEVR